MLRGVKIGWVVGIGGGVEIGVGKHNFGLKADSLSSIMFKVNASEVRVINIHFAYGLKELRSV